VKATLFSAILLAGPLSGAASQDPVVIPESAVCAECSVRLERVVSLRDPDGRAFLSDPQVVVRTRTGEYLVVSGVAQYGFSVFSPTGRFVRRVGRAGRGPGEYVSILRISVGPADSLFVWDPGAIRMTVLTPEFERAREIAFETPAGRVSRVGSHYVGAGTSRTAEGEARPLLVFDAGGSLVRSFGGDGGPYDRSNPELHRRTLSAGDDGSVWAARHAEYLFERWDTLGNLVAAFRREALWFPPRKRGDPGSREADGPPQPGLIAVRTVPMDRAWTLSWVADEEWGDALSTVVIQGRARSGVRREDRSRHRDTVFELLDLANRRVIGRLRVDELFESFAAPDEVYRYEESAGGEPVVQIYRLVPGSN
jgi:hypothetical protein